MDPERSEPEGVRDWKTFSPPDKTDSGRLAIKRQEEFSQTQASPVQTSRWLAPVLVLMSSVTAISVGYMLHERAHATQLSADNRLMRAALAEMRHEVDALTLKISDLSSQRAAAAKAGSQFENTAELSAVPGQSREIADGQANVAPHKKLPVQNQSGSKQVADDRKNTEGAHQPARNARGSYTELTGSIARNHEELVVLEQRGQRSYFEFDLSKSKAFQRIGPLSVLLRKVNRARQRYNIDVLVGGNRISKKDLSIYEPLLLYPEGSRRPCELVVNRIAKDKVHGYVSAPRYSDSELETNGTPANGPPQPEPSESQLASRTAPEQSWGVKFRKLVSRLR